MKGGWESGILRRPSYHKVIHKVFLSSVSNIREKVQQWEKKYFRFECLMKNVGFYIRFLRWKRAYFTLIRLESTCVCCIIAIEKPFILSPHNWIIFRFLRKLCHFILQNRYCTSIMKINNYHLSSTINYKTFKKSNIRFLSQIKTEHRWWQSLSHRAYNESKKSLSGRRALFYSKSYSLFITLLSLHRGALSFIYIYIYIYSRKNFFRVRR